jgi:hypothetical protein
MHKGTIIRSNTEKNNEFPFTSFFGNMMRSESQSSDWKIMASYFPHLVMKNTEEKTFR